MALLKFIPNLLTSGNLLCGVFAILMIFQGQLQTAVWLVLLAALLDFFDGFTARLLKVSGELGKQLDSLADLVTFGVAPSFMLYALSDGLPEMVRYGFVLPAAFSAFRLAKFNIDTRQSVSFIGVPTPITGIACVSWAMADSPVRTAVFGSGIPFIIYCVLISLLLVSEIRLPSAKIVKGPLQQYAHQLFLLAAGLTLIIIFGWTGIQYFYGLYVLSSVLVNFAGKSSS